MEIIFVFLAILLIAGIALMLWWISTSNDFHRKDVKIKEALSGIEVALTNRYDKLTKLLDVTKGYAKHEKETFAQIVQLRKGMSVNELSEVNAQCDKLMASINAVAEGYPELRSAEMFRELQSGINESEAHLQAARRLYNSNVTLFNTKILIFPSSVVANAKKLQKADFFVAEEHKKDDVKMEF